MKSSKKDDPISDQGHKKVFRAFGYMVPVGKDGRRLWSKGFKEKIGKRLALGRLSIEEVEKKCGLPKSVLNEWKRDAEDALENKSSDRLLPKAVFAELKMKKDNTSAPAPISTPIGKIIFKHGECEVTLPPNFPVDQLAKLIRTLGAAA